MEQRLRCAVTASFFLIMTAPAHATVGCTVMSNKAGAETVNLYLQPDDTSGVLSEIPLDDIVLYPVQELAPEHADNWVWVRYDSTQEDIWNSGIYGWMRPEDISDFCG